MVRDLRCAIITASSLFANICLPVIALPAAEIILSLSLLHSMSKTIIPYTDQQGTKKEQVADMFNNISKTYDFLNHFLSLGIDVLWRKMAINELKASQPKLILDVATGTGDFAFEALSILKPEKIIGVDISQGMLDIAQQKINKRGLNAQFSVKLGDSEKLPFDAGEFDAVTVAYGVRNFEHLETGLADIRRVLKPGGKAVILEFSKPKVFPVKQLYKLYFNYITPGIGKLFSKDARAYSYLPESVAAFPDGAAFIGLMDKVGFKNTKYRPLAFGICSIYTGVK
jgi:demethylmenaquinone methyltransferase/2-methoxy-6-polyprenyl-1,4-benzoquinol methylase